MALRTASLIRFGEKLESASARTSGEIRLGLRALLLLREPRFPLPKARFGSILVRVASV
jgi:hypothetical protein